MAQQMVKQKQQQQQGRTQWRALRVDSQGREIDEKGMYNMA